MNNNTAHWCNAWYVHKNVFVWRTLLYNSYNTKSQNATPYSAQPDFSPKVLPSFFTLTHAWTFSFSSRSGFT